MLPWKPDTPIVRPGCVLALDLSSKTGYAYLRAEWDINVNRVYLLRADRIEIPQLNGIGPYPWCYQDGAEMVRDKLVDLIRSDLVPQLDDIVIEVPTLGKDRFAQQWLGQLHHAVQQVAEYLPGFNRGRVHYLDVREWRSNLRIRMSADQLRANRRLSEAKRRAVESGVRVDKRALGVKGRVTAKHLAIRWVEGAFGLKLPQKDNDIADAICLGSAWVMGASVCEGPQARRNGEEPRDRDVGVPRDRDAEQVRARPGGPPGAVARDRQ